MLKWFETWNKQFWFVLNIKQTEIKSLNLVRKVEQLNKIKLVKSALENILAYKIEYLNLLE